MSELLKAIAAEANPNVPQMSIGDNISVFLRIKEGGNERVQEFKGTVIGQHDSPTTPTFTVRRIASNGIGVERTFLTHSPRIEKVTVHRHSHVRRAKLYFLRERTGKRARLKQKFNK